MVSIGYIAALFIGLSLGLIGGGGSILTVPILVYLFRIEPQLATSYSLYIVGITSLIGSYQNYKLKYLELNKAIYFVIPAVASILVVRKFILPEIPETIGSIYHFTLTKNNLIMIAFGLLMLSSALAMIFKKERDSTTTTNLYRLSLIGLFVGLITGFLGAGGGFLIIPALLFFGGLTMKNAVGTSLLIIAVNSLLGFAGDVYNGIILDYHLLFSLSGMAIIGVIAGTFLLSKMNSKRLKPFFGWFVLIVGVLILFTEFVK